MAKKEIDMTGMIEHVLFLLASAAALAACVYLVYHNFFRSRTNKNNKQND